MAAMHRTAGVAPEGTPGSVVRDAVAVIRTLDAETIARDAIARAASASAPVAGQQGERIRAALRDARLTALRAWKRGRDNETAQNAGGPKRGKPPRA